MTFTDLPIRVVCRGYGDDIQRRADSGRLHGVRLVHVQLAERPVQGVQRVVRADDVRRQPLQLPLHHRLAAAAGRLHHQRPLHDEGL